MNKAIREVTSIDRVSCWTDCFITVGREIRFISFFGSSTNIWIISLETVAHGANTKHWPSAAYIWLAALLSSGPNAYAAPRYREKLGQDAI